MQLKLILSNLNFFIKCQRLGGKRGVRSAERGVRSAERGVRSAERGVVVVVNFI